MRDPADIRAATGHPRHLVRLGEDGEEDRGEDRDDRDHHEELDESKAGTRAFRA